MKRPKIQEWVNGYLIAYDEAAKHEITYYLPMWESCMLDLMLRMQSFWVAHLMDERPRIYCEIDIDEQSTICISIKIHGTGIKCEEWFSFRGEPRTKYSGMKIARLFNIHNESTARMFANEMDVLFGKFHKFLVWQFIADKSKEWEAAQV